MIKNMTKTIALVGCLGFGVTAAHASIINEIGDAGELPSTAQDTTGAGSVISSLDSISGTLINLGTSFIDDVDLYKIFINDPNAFSVTVSASLSVNNDALLWLFDSVGSQVLFDNDGSGGLLPQFDPGELSAAGGLAGDYFLGFDLFLTLPHNIDGSLDNGWLRDPIPFQTGPYTLVLTGTVTRTETGAVPEPATLALFGIGLAGMGFARRKKSA